MAVQPQEMVEETVGAEPAGAHHQPVAVEQFQHLLPLVLEQRSHGLVSAGKAPLHGRSSGTERAEKSRALAELRGGTPRLEEPGTKIAATAESETRVGRT